VWVSTEEEAREEVAGRQERKSKAMAKELKTNRREGRPQQQKRKKGGFKALGLVPKQVKERDG